MPPLLQGWLGVVLVLVWIGVGLQWLVNGRRYHALLDLQQAHEQLRLQIDTEMLAAARREVERRTELRH
jgi:hypothetical protein